MNRLSTVSLFLIILSMVFVFPVTPAFADVPSQVTNVRDTGETATTIDIAWDAPNNGGQVISGYKIEGALEIPGQHGTFSTWATLVPDTGAVTAYTLTGLSQGDFFKLRISAINSHGIGLPSAEYMAGTQWENNQDFSEEQHDFSENTQHGSGTQFAANQQFSGLQDFSSGAQTFAEGTQFAAGQTFNHTQVFDGAQTFASGTQFGAVQDFDEIGAFSQALTLTIRTTPTTEWFEIFRDNLSGITLVSGKSAPSGAADPSNYTSNKVIYSDFVAVTAGSDWNDIQFTDYNNNGIIDCTGTATLDCELADMSAAVSFAGGTVLTFDQIDEQTFGASTAFYEGQEFGKGQSFNAAMDFSGGAMTFANGMEFHDGQSFAGHDHDFNHDGLSFGGGGTFEGHETFGDNMDFSGGTQFFEGKNTFGDGAMFAMQDWSSFDESTDMMNFASPVGPATDWFTILSAVNGFSSPISVTSGGDFVSGVLFIDFNKSPASGQQYNDVTFNDGNGNGKIDCIGTDTADCELVDLIVALQLNGSEQFDIRQEPVQVFGENTQHGGGTTWSEYQTFSTIQDFSGGAMNFTKGMEFAANQDFSQGGYDHDFHSATNIEFPAGAIFPPGEIFGGGMTFNTGADLNGINTFGDESIFPANYDWGGNFETSGMIMIDPVGPTKEWAEIFAAANDGAVSVITTNSGKSYTSYPSIVFVDFAASPSTGLRYNDIMFTDSNGNGDIDCATAATCELADAAVAITLTGGTNVEITQDYVQDFGQNTQHGAGTVFPKYQEFDALQDFSGGALAFSKGVEFYPGQDFTAGGHDHDFSGESLTYKLGAILPPGEIFGPGADFSHGIPLFEGPNTFDEDTVFPANLDWGDEKSEATTLTIPGAVGSTTDWFTILNAGTGYSSPIEALGSGSDDKFYTGQVILLDFVTSPQAGNQYNDVTFTDINEDGKIQCTGTATSACELEDLSVAITLSGGDSLTITQHHFQDFAAGNIHGDGTDFQPFFPFDSIQEFGKGSMNFNKGMTFYAGQDFVCAAGVSCNHDFNHAEITYPDDATFEPGELFGDAADFSAGSVVFDGANSFGESTVFAAQDFASLEIESSTIGLGAVTNTEVEFIDIFGAFDTTDTSVDGGTDTYTSGMVVVEFSAVTGGSVSNEVVFTDANGNGEIDCVSDAACELADLDTGVTFTDSTTVMIMQDYVQTFEGTNTFAAGSAIGDNQDFSTVAEQTFAGAITFGNGVEFFEDQDLSSGVHTFGDAVEFNGNVDFADNQVFGEDAIFDSDQDFTNGETYDFTAEGIQYGTVGDMDFGEARTFGEGADFAENQDFTAGAIDHDFHSATDITFSAGTVFDVTEDFGAQVNFDGAITFPDGIDMPEGAEFSGQTFVDDKTPDFDNFSTFGAGVVFLDDDPIDFEDSAYFEGAVTFTDENHVFGDGTTFTDGVDFDVTTTFGVTDFGTNADLTGSEQVIPAGSQFGEGTTFAVGQELLGNTVLSTGLLLGTVECADATCTVTDDDVLSAGEKVTPGVAPAAIPNTVTEDNPSFSVDGLGLSLTFESITTDGSVDVTVMDPAVVLGTTGAGPNPGSLLMESTNGPMETVSSVIDISLTGSTDSSGEMQIVLPYDEDEIGAYKEGALEVLHYTGGEWIVEDDCTIDTSVNEITCNVTSLSPFSIGGSVASGGGKVNPAPYLVDEILVSVDSNDSVMIDENNPANIMAHVGDEITVTLNVNDNGGPDNVDIVSLYTNFVDGPSGMNKFYANNFNDLGETSTSFYEWNKYTDDLSFDHSGNVTFTEPVTSIGDVLSISFTMIWNDVMSQSEVMSKLSDYQSSYIKDSLPFTIEIVDSSVAIPDPEPTAESDVSADPEPTAESDVSADPEPTAESDVSADPEPTAESDVSESDPVSSNTDMTISGTMTLDDDNNTTVPYEISGGTVTNAVVNTDNSSIVINIAGDSDGVLVVSPSESTQNGIFMVLVDGEEWDDVTINGNEVTVMFPAGAEEIEVIGTFVVPEFGTIAAMILVISIISIIAISAKSRLSIIPRI